MEFVTIIPAVTFLKTPALFQVGDGNDYEFNKLKKKRGIMNCPN